MIVLLLAGLVLVSSAAGAVENTYEPFDMTILPGETGEVQLILASAPSGLSGYSLNVRVSPEGGALLTAVAFPAWAGLSDVRGVPGQDIRLMAVDLGGEIGGNSEDILLATLTIPGVSSQPLSLSVYDAFYDDDEGARIIPQAISARVTGIREVVTAIPTGQETPGPEETPTTSPTPGTIQGSATPAVPGIAPGQAAQGTQYTLGLVATGAPETAPTPGITIEVPMTEPGMQRTPFASLPGMAGALALLVMVGLWLRERNGRG